MTNLDICRNKSKLYDEDYDDDIDIIIAISITDINVTNKDQWISDVKFKK